MNKKWQISEVNQEEIDRVSTKFNLNNLLASILVNRRITDDEIDVYLKPTRNNFHNPFLMPDMEIAVERIIRAIDSNEKIIIFGDYDVDGITSITVLKSFLEERGISVGQYIPNRLEEGYGLNKTAIDQIVKDNYDLMITVDCGISGIEEIDYANSLGLETIVTDHHEVGDSLPKALAVVDAKRKDNQYPCRDLAGVGVVFKLIQALGIKLGLYEKEYLKFLDIVCVGTISDIVPLVDENRVIAKLGLMLVEQTRNMGLKSLLISSGYKNIDSNTISFGVAPRINACGRMGHADEALKLFLSKDIYEVNELTKRLNDYNKLRQDKEKAIYNDALKQIEEKKLEEKNAIIVGGENWHHGVIGIVSSKITELYFKPSILLCYEDDLAKGSGRSIPGFDLHEALMKCQDTIDRFGGHAMAIGISIKKDDFSKFKDEFEEYAIKSKIDKIVPVINIDKEVQLKNISKEDVSQISLLEPFGEANKMPLFLYKNLKIQSIRALSDGKHLKLSLKDDNLIIDAIGFNMGELSNEYLIGNKIDVVGTLEINKFNNQENIQINLKDIRKSY